MRVQRNNIDEATIIELLGHLLYRLNQIHYNAMKCIAPSVDNLDKNAYLESLLAHCRVIDEFFKKPMDYENRAINDPKMKKYPKNCFFAIHCMDESDYVKLYKQLEASELFLKPDELNSINRQLLHASSAEPILDRWKPALKSLKALDAFKMFAKYQNVKKLLDKNSKWTTNINFKELVKYLSSY